MEYKTPLANAQGLGAAKSGSGHWWLQRVTAVALIPLTFWQLKLMSLLFHAPYTDTVSWLSVPINGACIMAWLLAAFYHAALGLQVVIEDYVSTAGLKIISVWLCKLMFLFVGLLSLLALFRTVSLG